MSSKNDSNIFAQKFLQCRRESSYSLANRKQKTDLDYRKARQIYDALYSEIEQKLGQDRLLVNRLDAAHNHLSSWIEEWVYEQGFRDCIYLLNWLRFLPSSGR